MKTLSIKELIHFLDGLGEGFGYDLPVYLTADEISIDKVYSNFTAVDSIVCKNSTSLPILVKTAMGIRGEGGPPTCVMLGRPGKENDVYED